jgi:hypothetical protein
MIATGLLMWRERILNKIGKFVLLVLIAGAVVLPWFFLAYQQYASETLGTWFYAVQVGNEERLLYSQRFPQPIFYLIEMTQPYPHVHPISAPLYILSLFGLGFWLWRRKQIDKFSLIWFFVVYAFFTLIPNKVWRYVTPVFPILAISASDFILFMWNKVKEGLQPYKNSLRRISLPSVTAVVFVLLIGVSFIYSWGNAHSWVAVEHVYIPIKEATQYVSENSMVNESLVILFTGNYFSTDMVKFYLQIYDPSERVLWPYPDTPADAYKPDLNETFLIESCKATNVKYLLLYEHGDITYFDSDWKSYDVFDRLINSGSFTMETSFGIYPRQITVLGFTPSS